jgi:hypothetical protein
MVASLISRSSWTQEFPGRALLVLNSCNSRTPELLSFLRDLFQAIQPGLVTSMHSAGIFIEEGDSTRTLNHFFGDHLATIRGWDEIPGVVKDGIQAAALAKPGQAAVRNEFVNKASDG